MRAVRFLLSAAFCLTLSMISAAGSADAKQTCGGEGQHACAFASAQSHGKLKIACPKGEFLDLRNGGECWSCPDGYDRTAAPVTAKNACRLPAHTVHAKATRHGRGTGLLKTDCPKGQFYDIGKGYCYSCPKHYDRTATAVTSSDACARRIAAKDHAAAYKSKGLCPKDAFFDPIDGGTCWSCPKGFDRSLASVKADNACVKPLTEQAAAALAGETVYCDKGLVEVRGICRKKGQCGKQGERPCLLVERIPSCDKGLVEDFSENKCVPSDKFACRATIGTIAEFKRLTEEAQKTGKEISNAAIDAIPGARNFLQFMERQGHHLKQEEQKLLDKIDLSQVTKQFENLVANHPKELDRLAEMAAAVVKARKKIEAVLLDPQIMCSGSGQKIAKALENTGLKTIFAGLSPGLWQQLNPISTAHAAATPVNQLSVKIAYAPPFPGAFKGLSAGVSFATDFQHHHSLSIPIEYSKSWPKPQPKDDDLVMAIIKELGKVSFSLGWKFYDGQTNWLKNDVFNWAMKMKIANLINVAVGSGGFGGITLALGSVSGSAETVMDLLDLEPAKLKAKADILKSKASIGGTIGGSFKIPLK